MVVVPESYVSREWVNAMSMDPEQRRFNPASTGKRLQKILKGNDSTAQKRSRFLHELKNFKTYQQDQFQKNLPIQPPAVVAVAAVAPEISTKKKGHPRNYCLLLLLLLLLLLPQLPVVPGIKRKEWHTVPGVRKEEAVHFIMYHLIRTPENVVFTYHP